MANLSQKFGRLRLVPKNGLSAELLSKRKEARVPIGPWEIVILLVILVVIFGASRLAQVGGALGKSVREFRGAMQEEPKPSAPPAPVVPAAPPVSCPTCQAANPAGQKFCSTCGASLLAPVAEVASPAPEVGAAAGLTAAASPPEAAAPPPEDAAPTPASAAPPAVAETSTSALHAAHPAAVPAENTCPSCATVNPPGQPFCGQCGTRLTRAA
jgi:TatA/E family protein of Tat protein translocase